MSSKGSSILGLRVAGILVLISGAWLLYLSLGSESIMMTVGAFAVLTVGALLTVMGLKAH